MLRVDRDGNRCWYNEHNQYHRENGPAIEYWDGSKEWYLNNKLHREDGPSCEYNNGSRYWYLYGTQYTEKEYREKVRKVC